jgi:hypothetical protein
MEFTFANNSQTSVSVFTVEATLPFCFSVKQKTKTKRGTRTNTAYCGLDKEAAIKFANTILELAKEIK